MSLADFFPGSASTLYPVCRRCGSVVARDAMDRHHRWHAAVDTGATTALPSDSAPRSSGAGRPNPKDQR